ncbi:MAG: hypothetical protein RSA91_00980 [Bacilli bacterium]
MKKLKEKIKGIFIFSERYKIYKNKINKNTNVEDLQFKRIELERKIEIVNSPVLYMTIVISISSLMISLRSYYKEDIKLTSITLIIGIILLVITMILSTLNIAQIFRNRSSRWRSEIIKLRIEQLKQEEINKRIDSELNKILSQKNNTLRKKILKFFRIK